MAKLLDSTRLITLVGVAGVGKTRLALGVAAAVAESYADGVWLVELAPVADPGLVPAAAAAALGVREQPGRPLAETLASHLHDKQLLLVLDNCEHLIGAAAGLTKALLCACPGLQILATSREALGVAGENIWPVPPLSVPPAADVSVADELDVYEAVWLFVQRAEAVEPDFVLSASVAPAVAEICRRLDGIPLAIELAAARVAVLAPAQIAARLDDRFRLLAAGSRTALPRHRSLQAALDSSYELLSDLERVLLRRVSVFAGGYELEAAEAVCAADDLKPDQVFDLLAGLVAKSLVVADTSGSHARYRLLETIREYAGDKLAAAGETEILRTRHAAWCTGLAEQAEPELTGAQQAAWLQRLHVEYDNLRAGLHYSLAGGQPEQGLRLAAALFLFWMVRGHLSEGRAWLERDLVASPDASPELRAKALWGAGGLSLMAGDFAAGLAMSKESLALAREVGDTRGVARALLLMGGSIGAQDPAKARPLLQESVALARQVQDRWCLATSLGLFGFTEVFQGDLKAARPLFEECVAIARETHDRQGLRIGLLGLGRVAVEEGDPESAQTLLGEGLATARELDDPWWTGMAMVYLGELARAQGQYARARTMVEEGLALAHKSGSQWALTHALWCTGKITQAAEGDLDAASRLFEEALPLAQTTGAKLIVAGLLLSLGELSQTLGDLAAARARFDEGLASARDGGVRYLSARSWYRLGQIARSQGDHLRAETFHHQALRLQEEMGRLPDVTESLEALAGLAAEQGRCEYAARLLGAAESLREATSYVRPPAEQSSYDADLALAQQGLSSEALTTAWAQGRALSMREAVTYAAKGRGPRQRPATGWASLTPTEREVARLAAQSLTNPEIGERLFISRRTVQTHLAHIYAKLDITSRKQLASEAAAASAKRADT